MVGETSILCARDCVSFAGIPYTLSVHANDAKRKVNSVSTTKKSSDAGKAFRERVTGRKERSGGYGEQLFCKLDLSREDKSKCKAWVNNDDIQPWDLFNSMVDDGYKLSFKYDTYNECKSVFAMTDDAESPNYGLILVGRGGSAYSALVELLYKHIVMCDAHWPDPSERSAFEDWDS